MSKKLIFSDSQARAVFVFGILYPSYVDQFVKFKCEYNDDIAKSEEQFSKVPTGKQRYEAQVFRSLFQTIGRCMRHINDSSTIIFLEERLRGMQSNLPNWIQQSINLEVNPTKKQNFFENFY
jgi:Rad3-related DNA helicase